MAPEDPDLASASTLLRQAKPARRDAVAALMRANLRRELLALDSAPVKVGRFEILGEIGRGAMGTVYSARDDVLHRNVALKVLRRPDGAASDAMIREARALAQLAHPNVVTVFEVGTGDDEHPYIAMELVAGVDLRRWLAGKPPRREILARLVEAGRGLAAAHAAQLVHGDFKPQNVLVGADGVARVVDFGLARDLTLGADPSEPVGGTLLYLAPECLEGAPPSAKSDQYAFAVTLFESLAGRPPYAAKSVAGLLDAMDSPPPIDALDVPRRLRPVLRRGLARSPADRFDSMEALLDALDAATGTGRRWWLLTATLVVTAGATAIFAQAPSTDRCDEARAAAQRVWNPARSQRIQEAFATADPAFAVDAHRTVDDAISRYVADWTAMHGELCRSPRASSGDTMYDVQMRCLHRRRSELEAMVEAMERTTSPQETADAVTAATELTPSSSCEASEGLRRAHLDPETPERARAAQQVRTILDRGWAAYELGRYEDAQRQVRAARDQAERLGFDPVTAEVDLLAGAVQARIGDLPRAEALLDEVQLAAARVGNDRLAAAASLMLLRTVMFSEAPQRVHELAPFARAAAVRAGTNPLEVDGILGEALLSQERPQEAVEVLTRVVDAEFGPRRHAIVMTTLASAHLELGHTDEAVALYQRAYDRVRTAFGERHPSVPFHMVRLGRGLREAGAYDRADAVLTQALTRIEALHGDEDRAYASALLELGKLRAAQGDPDRARPLLQRAEAIRIDAYGPDHPRVTDVRDALAALAGP